MVRAEVIRKRLNKLDEYLAYLSGLQRYSLAEFINEPERFGSAERFLQLAIECVNDIGNHIIADDHLGVVNWYSDIPAILADKGIIDHEILEKWLQMIGFRNILVHEYLEIDRHIVYDALQHRISDLKTLRIIFAQFI